ncbi:MAG TPA: hypothetical protein VE057_18835 [Archangium sp.]|nr:hypothetical protein [Archangium sp.]
MPNEIKSALVSPYPMRSGVGGTATVKYVKGSADLLRIELRDPSSFKVTPNQVKLPDGGDHSFPITFERLSNASGDMCAVHWELGAAPYDSQVKVLPAQLDVVPVARALRSNVPVNVTVRHPLGAGPRVNVKGTTSFSVEASPLGPEKPVAGSPFAETELQLRVKREQHAKGRHVSLDFELDGERLSVGFTLEKKR